MNDRTEKASHTGGNASSASTPEGTMRASYVRLVADEHGESHFEDATNTLDVKDFAPPAAPLYVGVLSEAKSVFVVGAPPDWKGDAPHPSPQRQIFVTMKGSYEVQASAGPCASSVSARSSGWRTRPVRATRRA